MERNQVVNTLANHGTSTGFVWYDSPLLLFCCIRKLVSILQIVFYPMTIYFLTNSYTITRA